MNVRKDQEAYDKMKKLRSKNEYRCSTCGHTVYIHPTKDKVLCEFCCRYIYRDEKYNIENLSRMQFLQTRYIHFQRKKKENNYEI